MKQFIAHFDFLGYKQFILSDENSPEHLRRRAVHILRDIELALGQDNMKERRPGIVTADLQHSRINCLNVSDTVIFYTIDDSQESLQELLDVSHKFNWSVLFFNMPARGAICFDDIEMLSGSQKNEEGARYNANLIYGKGLVKAHLKAEEQSWAGCVIDNSVIDELKRRGTNVEDFLEPYAKLYNVPYKNKPPGLGQEYALKINKGGLNEASLKNATEDIRRTFAADYKPVDTARVQEIMNNTITYLETFKE